MLDSRSPPKPKDNVTAHFEHSKHIIIVTLPTKTHFLMKSKKLIITILREVQINDKQVRRPRDKQFYKQ